MPTLNVVEPQNQIHKRRLARARETHQPDFFARTNRQIQPAEHLYAFCIGEIHILEADLALSHDQVARAGLIGNLVRSDDDTDPIGDVADVVEELQEPSTEIANVIDHHEQQAGHHRK